MLDAASARRRARTVRDENPKAAEVASLDEELPTIAEAVARRVKPPGSIGR
ncbi:hypothetical protein [Streptomyces sp. SID3343]|uniref:hypothetical protein n=1 Tax=Streptomyces sp. SID3343 TaxID=2690260 RepID=UPI001369D452|nr:hypothetical protein [Streptomyces sp. SID3343]MYV99631.1 hypothetical protein [Streptomyces sp. SID3343]